MDKLYALFETVCSPLVPLWLYWRCMIGKEDYAHLPERFGRASVKRPKGTLMWLHAASVGEAVSVLPLIYFIRQRFPHMHVLLTTGTRTSAQLMRQRLPRGAIHQYVPVDTKTATQRFMRHWRPDIAFLVESELWPNLIYAADRWQCFLGIINARMSKRSFLFWQRRPAMIRKMLSCFNVIYAQSEDDADRLRRLEAKTVHCVGNLKHDADALPCDESALVALKGAIGARPVWLAASTHPGEETAIMQAHMLLAATRPDLLTIIVPRHPERGGKIAGALAKRFTTGLRSRNDSLTPQTQFYVADTLGELGLFYRLVDVVFMGGSLVSRGGQNPLEAARLSCAVVTGPHTHNFSDMYREMEQAKACVRIHNAQDLAAQIGSLLGQTERRQHLQAAAKTWVGSKTGATEKLLAELGPLFLPPDAAA